MQRTNTTFSLLQAVAAVAILATILWSVGIPSFRFAEAANVISFSDTLSDSAPSAASDHTISFVTPSGMVAGETISLNFGTAVFSGIGSLVAQDLDLNISGVEQTLIDGAASGASWNVTASGDVIDITSGTSTIGTNATITIRIGENAFSGGTGTNQISNPATTTSYAITVDVGSGTDTGTTRVAIVSVVTVNATVQTQFDFTVLGVDADLIVNGATTTATTTSTGIPFGTLVTDEVATGAQDLQVSTNAVNGFVVTVQADHQLLSTNGADIDGFFDGTYESSPTFWASPSQSLGQEEEYGHWGITTDDNTIYVGLTDAFDVGGTGQMYVSASTTPVEVFRHNGPTAGSGQGQGLTRVGYSVEVSALQEAANDYTATLTYVATPVF
jgi:hypothetical protein